MLPKRYTIPSDRIPRPWSQGAYDCCVAASITKVLEVINYLRTGKYTMFSKGYTYGRHSRPDKTQGGMGYDYAMESLLTHGTIPKEMFPYMNEIPDIIEDIMEHPNISQFDKEAEKTKIIGYVKFKGDIHFYDNVKQCLYEKQMPLVGNMVGKRHCAVIVGWDEDKLLYHDHKGSDKLFKGRFNEAYYLDGCVNMGFKDVKSTDWFYEQVKKVCDEKMMIGTSYDTFEPNKPVTRAELATVICRLLEMR